MESPSISASTVQAATFISAGGGGDDGGGGGSGSVLVVAASVAPSSGSTTGGSSLRGLRRRSSANSRARLVPRSTVRPTAMLSSATSPGAASPTTEKSSAPAASPI